MEVDLLDRHARLAIEIDSLQHFYGEDAWRYDRGKDFLLQQSDPVSWPQMSRLA